MIDDILTFNKQFVAEKEYEKYITTGQPDRRLAVLSCCLLYTSDAADE